MEWMGTSLAQQRLRLYLPMLGGVGSIPGQGVKIPYGLWLKNHIIKQKQYCNKFNKFFKKKTNGEDLLGRAEGDGRNHLRWGLQQLTNVPDPPTGLGWTLLSSQNLIIPDHLNRFLLLASSSSKLVAHQGRAFLLSLIHCVVLWGARCGHPNLMVKSTEAAF